MINSLKFKLSIMLILSCLISFAGCENISQPVKNDSTNNASNSFSQADAIAETVKDHSDFSANSNGTVTKDLSTGGPMGSTEKVAFTAKVESAVKDSYFVTLTKDWGITVNGTYVKSFWKYKVTKDSILLIDSVDHESLPNTMK